MSLQNAKSCATQRLVAEAYRLVLVQLLDVVTNGPLPSKQIVQAPLPA
jgi:hypothetical protein